MPILAASFPFAYQADLLRSAFLFCCSATRIAAGRRMGGGMHRPYAVYATLGSLPLGNSSAPCRLRRITLIRPIRKRIAHLPHKGEGFCIAKRLFIAEGDSSTILLRKIAYGTAQNDSEGQRQCTNVSALHWGISRLRSR